MPSVYPAALDAIANKIDHVDVFNADDINTPAGGIMALQTLIGAGSQQPTPNATALTVVKRTSDGSASFGYVNATLGLQIPKSTAAAPIFAVDAANFGAGFTLANNANAAPFGLADNFAGVFMVKETAADLHGALVVTCGHNLKILWDSSGSLYTENAAGTASKINIYLHGSLFCPIVENKRGGSRTFVVACLMRLQAVNA